MYLVWRKRKNGGLKKLNRKGTTVYTAVLRSSYREDGKTKSKFIAQACSVSNLTLRSMTWEDKLKTMNQVLVKLRELGATEEMKKRALRTLRRVFKRKIFVRSA